MIVYEIILRLIIASRSYGGPVIPAPLHPQHKTKKPKNKKNNSPQTHQKTKTKKQISPRLFKK